MTDHRDTASPSNAAGVDDWLSVILLMAFAVVMSSFLLLAVPLFWLSSLAINFGQRALAIVLGAGILAVTGRATLAGHCELSSPILRPWGR